MLPIAVRPDGRRAVVVGGGDVARRKAETLAAAGFQLVVVAPAIDARLRASLAASGGSVVERTYQTGDLDGAFLALAATSDDAVNERVVADARSAGILVCDAAAPERGDFTMPATVRGRRPHLHRRYRWRARRHFPSASHANSADHFGPSTRARRARSRACAPTSRRSFPPESAPACCARWRTCRSPSSRR